MSIQRKKYYKSPQIETVFLDQEIVIRLESPPYPPNSAAPVDRDKPSFGPSSVAPTSTSNPFGGSHPDYGDM
jgi:hypothetical protein